MRGHQTNTESEILHVNLFSLGECVAFVERLENVMLRLRRRIDLLSSDKESYIFGHMYTKPDRKTRYIYTQQTSSSPRAYVHVGTNREKIQCYKRRINKGNEILKLENDLRLVKDLIEESNGILKREVKRIEEHLSVVEKTTLTND